MTIIMIIITYLFNFFKDSYLRLCLYHVPVVCVHVLTFQCFHSQSMSNLSEEQIAAMQQMAPPGMVCGRAYPASSMSTPSL